MLILFMFNFKRNGPTIVLESHETFGTETSARNSEVIHAGIYYPPDSLKTKLCIRGKELLYSTCKNNQIPFKQVGKWIVAQTNEERLYLEKLHNHASSIGVPTLMVSIKKAKELEPDVLAQNAILESPTTGIIDSHSLMLHLLGEFEDQGGSVAYKSRVCNIEPLANGTMGYKVSTMQDNNGEIFEITTDCIVNSAGLYAAQVSNLILPADRHLEMHYAKGNYFSHTGSSPKATRLIYPCPQVALAGLGTHLTIDLGGRMKFGPDVQWIEKPDDYTVDGSKLEEVTKAVRTYLPGITKESLIPDYAGIRPKLVSKESKIAADFVIRKEEGFPGFINLLGIESPGLTSSLAIAEYVGTLL